MSNQKKKILLITYYFSPQQTPRAFRWEALVKSLSKKGYSFDILLPSIFKGSRPKITNVNYFETNDNDLLGGKLIKFYYRNIYRGRNFNSKRRTQISSSTNFTGSFLRKIGSNLLWPDMDITSLWYASAIDMVKKLISENKYEVVISSASPFVDHLIGYYVKRKVGNIKWIAEYGDPFSFKPIGRKMWFKLLDRKIENRILQFANFVVVPIKESRKMFIEHFSTVLPQKIKIIPHAFIKTGPQFGDINWKLFEKNRINVVYAGVFFRYDLRTPLILFDALKYLKGKNYKLCTRFRFHFFGVWHTDLFKNLSNYKDLIESKIVVLHGPVERGVCLKAYSKSDYLLNIANYSSSQLPSKLVEYLFSKKPIVSLETKNSIRTNWPFVLNVNYTKEDVIKFLESLEAGRIKYSFNEYNRIRKKYELNNITRQYMALLK